MIDFALDVVRNEVNTFIKAKTEADPASEIIHLTAISDDQGRIIIPANSLSLSLLNIEEERQLKANYAQTIITNSGDISQIKPAVHLNLDIIFIANFTDYKTALKHISHVIYCFQEKPVFTPENTPALGTNISQLIFELNAVGLQQQHYIWSMIGVKSLPAIIYKARLVAIQGEPVVVEGGAVTEGVNV